MGEKRDFLVDKHPHICFEEVLGDGGCVWRWILAFLDTSLKRERRILPLAFAHASGL